MRTALSLLLLASPALADVLDVRGPSPDYNEIGPAVSAAQPGDVVRVWPGSYQVFTVDKSLTVVRATANGTVAVQGTVRVKDLTADERVELVGVQAAGVDGPGLIVSSCAGSVRLRECTFFGADTFNWFAEHPGAFVLDSDDVVFTYCSARGGFAPWGEDGGWGANGLTAQDSTLSLFASTFTGTDGTVDDDPGASGYGGGYGIEVSGAGTLWVAGCTLVGGDGGPADYDLDWWTGEYGYGGNGGWAHYGNTPAWFHDCTFDPGLGGWSPDSSHYGYDGQDSAGGTYVPGVARLLRTSWLTDDASTLTVRAQGAPGDEVWLRIAEGPGYRFHPVRGPLLVDTAPAPLRDPWLRLGTIDGSGVLLVDLPTADLPTGGHLVPHLQGAFHKGKDYFGSSSWTVLLDSSW